MMMTMQTTFDSRTLYPLALTYQVGALVCDETPGWFVEIARDCGWQPIKSKLSKRSNPRSSLESADALVGWSTKGIARRFAQIRASNPTHRPVLVMIGHEYSHLADESDVFVTPNSDQLYHALTRTLTVHREARSASETVDALRLENEHLQQQIHDYEQSSEELLILKEAMVSNIAHELRTPMLQIKAAVSQLVERVKDPQHQTIIEHSVRATERLEGVIHNITMLADELDIRPDLMIAQDVLELVMRDRRRGWESRKTLERLRFQIDEQRFITEGDPKALSNALQQLIDNALKFSDKDSPIEIELFRHEDRVYFSVRDYGVGIAPDQIERIFEPFYQIDGSSTRSYGGTGIGLALVRLILEKHNTHISVQSIPQQGSIFTFSLPIIR
jgi:signal transduction histidine kinase